MNFIIKTMKKLRFKLKNRYLWLSILAVISLIAGFGMLLFPEKINIWIIRGIGVLWIAEGASYIADMYLYYLKNKVKKFKSIPLPEVLHDNTGYPTKEFLDFIKGYTPKVMPIFDFLTVLKDEWYASSWGFKLHSKYKYGKKRKLELHTGGWSGNEELIRAIKTNPYLTSFTMKYVSWKTGGHFYFEIPC